MFIFLSEQWTCAPIPTTSCRSTGTTLRRRIWILLRGSTEHRHLPTFSRMESKTTWNMWVWVMDVVTALETKVRVVLVISHKRFLYFCICFFLFFWLVWYRLRLTIIYIIDKSDIYCQDNPLITVYKISKNHEKGSSQFLKPKDFSSTVINDYERQKILTFKKK